MTQRQTSFRRKVKENLAGWLYVMPVMLGILIFTLFPVCYAFLTSFFDYGLGMPMFELHGFGLDNYIKPFTTDWYWYGKALSVTAVYAVINIPLTLVLSFALAVFLNQKLPGMRFFRVLYYLPVLIPAVCSGMLWKNVTDTGFGVANQLLYRLNLPLYTWFDSADTAMVSFIFIGLFSLGGSMILWLAQLKNVPAALYESARLDGAGRFRQLVSVTIPMCSPMIFYNLIMSVIGTLQTFTAVFTLTGGAGPDYSLNFYLVHVYNAMFTSHLVGYASAMSFILFLIIGLLTTLSFRTNQWVYYGEEA